MLITSCSQVGDGTTSVVLITGEILKNCKPFIEDNVHPQIISRGLRKATQLALGKIKEMAVHVKMEDHECVLSPCYVAHNMSLVYILLLGYFFISPHPFFPQVFPPYLMTPTCMMMTFG